MEKKDKQFATKLADMAKGILIGGSLGLIVSWTGLMPLGRALGLGLMVGCLAGLSFQRMRDTKSGKKKD